MMKIYSYHPETGEYTGEGQADLNPVSKEYDIVPAFATILKPPSVATNQKAIFKDDKWTIATIPKEEPYAEPELTEAEKIEADNAAIRFQIAVIEEKGIRAMREVLVGKSDIASEVDGKTPNQRMLESEAQIAELRQQLR